MKLRRLLFALLMLAGCQNLTPAQQANVTVGAQVLATAAQIAAPFAGNPALSAGLYALGSVAGAYASSHSAQVPASVISATTPKLPALAGLVAPYVTGGNNSTKTVDVINSAAALLAGSITPSKTTRIEAYRYVRYCQTRRQWTENGWQAL